MLQDDSTVARRNGKLIFVQCSIAGEHGPRQSSAKHADSEEQEAYA